MEKAYRNIGYPFIILLALVIFGFFKTYFGLFPHFNEHTTALVHFHATVLLLWFILLIVQPFLIRYRKLALHRLLGKFTYIQAPLIILSFVGMMIKQIGEAKAQNLNIALHMRYIVVTALVFINASLNRSLGIWFHVDFFYSALISISFVDLILLTLIYFDKVNGRRFKPFVISLILFLVVQPGIILLYHH